MSYGAKLRLANSMIGKYYHLVDDDNANYYIKVNAVKTVGEHIDKSVVMICDYIVRYFDKNDGNRYMFELKRNFELYFHSSYPAKGQYKEISYEEFCLSVASIMDYVNETFIDDLVKNERI